MFYRGAVVDGRDILEEKPLMMAADFGHWRTVQVLLQAGADPSLVNRDGLSAEGLASKEHYEEVISILRWWGPGDGHLGQGLTQLKPRDQRTEDSSRR